MRMNKLLAGACVSAIAALCASPAAQAANNISVKDASAATITMCTLDTGLAVQAACHVIVNTAGTKIDPATSGNQTNVQAAPGSDATSATAVQGVTGGKAVRVDGSAVTQPVSGTVTANAGTGTMAVSAAALPLPSGAATAALQPAINADLGAQVHVQNFPATQPVSGTVTGKLQDGAGTAITSTLINSKQRLDVNLGSGVVPGSTAPTYMDQIGGNDGTLARAFLTDASGRLAVNVNGSVPATEADGANTTIGSKADTASATGSQTLVSILKQLHADMIAATPAGTAIIGKVTTDQTTPGTTDLVHAASNITEPSNTPTISTSAYSSGFVLGGIQTFASQPTSGNITFAEVTFNSGTFAGTVDLFIYSASPTGGGTTDHAAFALTSTDTAKHIGTIHLTDLTSLGGTLTQVQASGFSIPYKLASGTSLFVVARVNGTPTFAGASDAIFTLVVNQ